MLYHHYHFSTHTDELLFIQHFTVNHAHACLSTERPLSWSANSIPKYYLGLVYWVLSQDLISNTLQIYLHQNWTQLEQRFFDFDFTSMDRNTRWIVVKTEEEKTRHVTKLAVNEKFTFFVLSSKNFVKVSTSWVNHFYKVLWA